MILAEPGPFRPPQRGALLSAFGSRTTGTKSAVTIVMPTGTGKTETMLALYAASLPECLLVVVPTDALREQIATKFERFGILKAERLINVEAPYPIVGRLSRRLQSAASAQELTSRCNVLVATAASLSSNTEAVWEALNAHCSELYVDEAHHIPATTWARIRNSFKDKPVYQFTATPYRRDGKRLGGSIIYNFPLKEAQRLNYFSPIRYSGVFDLTDPDRAVATRAISQLRADLADGKNHILMARASRKSRANELLRLYEELAEDLRPVLLLSGHGTKERRDALDAITSQTSRIIVCVDMLGEGYDLPNLKVAALHDPHRSLGVTLQFVGRFARTSADGTIGAATVVAPRTEVEYDRNLRHLHSEDADWNVIIEELSTGAIGEQHDLDDFERGFANPTSSVSIRSVAPKMSCVAYRTAVTEWDIGKLERMFPEERLLTSPINVNQEHHVVWFVSEEREQVQWGESPAAENVSHDLYAIYWDRDRDLLYINCSGLKGMYRHIATALCGESVEQIRGEDVYRALDGIARPVPTNIGVLDTRNFNRRFSMHVGADVTDGLPTSATNTKTQTNIFITGFLEGERLGAGVSLKGRLWRRQAATTLQEWVQWCDALGTKLIDESIDSSSILNGFIRPEGLESWPDLATLAAEWPLEVALDVDEQHRVALEGRSYPLLDTTLNVIDSTEAPPTIRFQSPSWSADYRIHLQNENVQFEAIGPEPTYSTTRTTRLLSSFLNEHGLRFILTEDAIIEPPGFLLKPPRDLPQFSTTKCRVTDWAGTNIRKESQDQERIQDSIQYRVIEDMRLSGDWDIILDDDGPGESADVVSLALRDDHFSIHLTHCKYSSEDNPGARVKDLYEVCGQAMKSTLVRRNVPAFFARLIKRERSRMKNGKRSGFMLGTGEELLNLSGRTRLLTPEISIEIVQPGLSLGVVSSPLLDLLAGAEVYLHETAGASLSVRCSA